MPITAIKQPNTYKGKVKAMPVQDLRVPGD